MRRPWTLLLTAGLVLAGAPPGAAEIGTLDAVPAATLLLPYFEVDLKDVQGMRTLITVMNTSDQPVIAHFTLWTDLGVVSTGWNAYLTGFDSLRVDLAALFFAGTVPPTSHNDIGVSPVGDYSLSSNAETGVGPGSASCNGQLPLPPLPPSFLDHIRFAHTGQPSPIFFGGLCGGRNLGDNVARGSLTIDVVRSCVLDHPGDGGYFVNGGAGAATNQNVLVGDYVFLDPANQRAEGGPLVHIEASSTDPRTQPGRYTFYARASGGADNREPLGTHYWLPYTAPDGGPESTRILYWRDPKRTISPFSCALTWPSPFPLANNQIAIFDEQENVDVPETSPFSPPVPGTSVVAFPAAAGEVTLDGPDFPVAMASGWMLLNLNSTVVGSAVPFEPLLQSWVHVQISGPGTTLSGTDASLLFTAADDQDRLLPNCDGAPDPAACS